MTYTKEQLIEGTKHLRELEAHLRSEQLGHEKFDFTTINTLNEEDVHKCGTAGCAMGEMPIVWPEQWGFFRTMVGKKTTEVYEEGEWDFSDHAIARWFGVYDDHEEPSELMHLFYPNEQCTTIFGGKHLEDDATKEQVADNIDAFIRKCRKEWDISVTSSLDSISTEPVSNTPIQN